LVEINSDIDGEVAVVTGGAGGLGAAVAVALAGAGARVAVADLDHDGARAVASELGPGHIALPIDVRSSASVRGVADAVSAQLGAP
jgi:NAD(P)-dependent dehydrogenase (short-subunit alcohol dehydrogenase family)